MRISSSARSRRTPAATPFIFSGNSMFSPTELCGNSASDWNTRQVGRRFARQVVDHACRAAGCRRRSAAPCPASMRSSVVLPRAGRPDDGEELALAHLEVDAVDRRQLAERPADADELQDRPRQPPPTWSAARALGRRHQVERLVVVGHDVVLDRARHLLLQAVPLDRVELLGREAARSTWDCPSGPPG